MPIRLMRDNTIDNDKNRRQKANEEGSMEAGECRCRITTLSIGPINRTKGTHTLHAVIKENYHQLLNYAAINHLNKSS